MIETLPAALARRARRGSSPLITHYDLDSGARTELSGTSFANWVDKTSNLLESLDVEPGAAVALPVLLEHPGHWMGLIWPLALWQRACTCLVIPRTKVEDAALVVIGPDRPAPVSGLPTLACSLHPLGLGLRHLPDGVADYSTSALAEPDLCLPEVLDPRSPAWIDVNGTRTHADIAGVRSQPGRVLVRPADPWLTFAEAVAGPLLGGGSSVIVTGRATPDRLADIARSERARLGD